ncbi:MAG: family 20 glycosylhydrolase [Bacteroidetes bacterium]|nr:family 20 glycosylhydrolase [Bacteroidota bacterium]
MKKKILSSVCILVSVFISLLSATANVQAAMTPFNVVPSPQSVRMTQGVFTFKQGMNICIKGALKNNNQTAGFELAAAISNAFKYQYKVQQELSPKQFLEINLFLDDKLYADSVLRNAKNKEEAYTISVTTSKIVVRAVSQRGIMHGVMTLIQMIEQSKDQSMSCFELVDYPDMKMRGISDDISRGQVSTPENFRRIIRFLARYKMNVYQPYIEDVFKFKNYPTVGVNRGALNDEDIKSILGEAKKYNIDVIPVFETLGHFENILSQPEFARFAEYPGSASLDVSNDSIYVLLENMLKEIFDAFPSSYINIAADESFDVGLGNSKKLVAEKGIAQVHADHYNKIFAICKKYNKHVMMYGDIILEHPEILSMIPKDIEIVDWDYGDKFSYNHVKKFKDAGFKFYVSPAVWNFTTTFPALNIALPNIQYFTRAGIEQGAEGMINSQWGDYGAETFRELNLFPFAWGAQCSWNYKGSNMSTFSTNFFRDFYGTDDPRINHLYQTLSNMYGDLLWHDVWQYPLMKFKRGLWMYYGMSAAARSTFTDWTMSDLKSTIDDLQKKATSNQTHFELMRWLVKLNGWYSRKAETQSMLLDKYEGNVVDSTKIIKRIQSNVDELKVLREEYKALWMKTNKADNLYLVEDKFNRMLGYFNEIQNQLVIGKLKPPVLESKWIYSKTNDTTYAPKATFRYEFDLKSKPSSALLQLIGDSYCKLYVNGTLADSVFACLQLSLKVEYGRVKMKDVTSLLKPGKNIIEVEAESFRKVPAAGCNVIGLIKSGNETLEIYSNDQWKSTTDGTNWLPVAFKNYPYTVVSPDFGTRRPSWIER